MPAQLGDRFSPRRRLAFIITLGLLTGLGPFTIDLYLPAFPALKADLLISDAQVQITLSATTLGFALGQLLVGPLSDRLGRKRPLLAMSALHVVASVLVAISPNVEFLTGMRALQGIGAAGGAVVAMAMARDLFDGRRLVVMLSRLALINGMAPIIAPLVGSWMVSFVSWRGVFWALALYGSTIVALVWLLIVETRPPSERTTGGFSVMVAAYRRVLNDRIFVGAWLTAAAAFAGLFSYVSTSSVLLQEVFGLSPRGFGAVFAICSVGVFVGVQVGSRLSHRIGPHRVLALGTAGMVLASAALLIVNAASDSYIPLIPTMFAFTLSFGACAPNAQVLGLQHHRTDSGVAASLMGALNMTAAAIVGPLIGLATLTSAAPMGIAMLACSGLAVVFLWTIIRPMRLQVRLD
ncbi:multidrug effflux MFS transporter [Tessaracoccus antarcticus]|uniref:Bcr/CflA family efflux MFS transporter n=1 Tax=Tessaracoccus antarcticus TaxID=2479848 RepID=A0A3M0G2E2_9ACTN|nr:multidrug effflux MFS transporter [Tessaracoccus antarcticus]RMB58748.1 Bcr/CflA family efflux MFS transporter [Tessaracoccus antarcticus]